jgi:hypothetical protein
VFISYAGVSTVYLNGGSAFTNGMRVLIRKIGTTHDFIVTQVYSPANGMCARNQAATAAYATTLTISAGLGYTVDLVWFNGIWYDVTGA